ncbi:MAG TPA: TonB-dependent receptor [Vicinamibacterales bacterium]
MLSMSHIRRWSVVTRLFMVTAVIALPMTVYAQEAVVSGTVTDSTGGVLPGVTVVAVHEASGNTFEAVTDERGGFRLPVRVGTYRLTLQLAGFATVARSGLELLVGQQAVVNVQMRPSGVQESVTVTAEAPLVDTTSSTLGGNIDPRQMQELPLNGRNWMDLALLAPGSKRNEGGIPDNRQGYSQINVDGQAVTQLHGGTDDDQPRFSRDAIAEFELVTNRFDATQGRSAGLQVNAITKSGTNTFSGLLSGYFRDDRFKAADFIQDRVVPYSNQQVSATFGGPIRTDRMHFFTNYEYEREPQTVTYNSPYPAFNVDQTNTRREKKAGARLDFQFTSQTRLTARYQYYDQIFFDGGGATSHPSAAFQQHPYTSQLLGTLTKVIGNSAVNELKAGYALFNRDRNALVKWKGGCIPDNPVGCTGTPRIAFRGYSFGGPGNSYYWQDLYSVRDDFSNRYNKGGEHVTKLGGEYVRNQDGGQWCNFCFPQLLARNSPPPANIEALAPVWDDLSTWNLAPLSPIVTQVRQAVSKTKFRRYAPQNMAAAWLQDDWKVTSRLTLNLGVRWDLQTGANSEKVTLLPWLPGDLPYDWNNVAPRLGFALGLNDRTVLRGGYGQFYTQAVTDGAHQTAIYTVATITEIRNDGRPDFVVNPFNGPLPAYEAVLAGACDINFRPGCVRREFLNEINNPWRRLPYSHQASIGIQRQLGTTMAVEADYVYTGGRGEETAYNVNLGYDPATGANYPFADINRRPFPDWGAVYSEALEGWSNSHGLQTSFKKRFSQRWQASATYTLAALRDADALPFQYGLTNGIVSRAPIGFALAPDVGSEYTLATSDQRHRAVVNGIWDAGYGLQLSGIYFYGSGRRYGNSYGGDLRDSGGGGGSARLRPDGTIVPRNTFVGRPIHRVDLRVQRHFPIAGNHGIDGIVEVFNLFNHENFGSYTIQESNRNYGNPAFNSAVAYQPRMLQLGFRLTF